MRTRLVALAGLAGVPPLNRRGLLAAIIGYVVAALPLGLFVWAVAVHDSELLWLFVTVVTAAPPTLALLGSIPRYERQSGVLLLVAAGLRCPSSSAGSTQATDWNAIRERTASATCPRGAS